MLARAIESACRSAWAAYRSRYSHETCYAFGLCVVSEDGLILGSAYATEEATLLRAAEYEFVLGGDTTARARAIRWLDADWPHSNDLREEFAAANERIRAENPDPARLRALYAEVLEKLAREGFFGEERDRIVLAVFGPDRDRSIERLNAETTVARFRAELVEGERTYQSLQQSS
ncbi:MAG: DUF4303 domain-containing protein [Polyangiales bacterium]